MDSTIDYLGFRFLDADMGGVRDALSCALSSEPYGYVVTPNVDHVVSYHNNHDPALVRAYDGARLQICDSRVLTMLAKMTGRRLRPVPGSDLTRSLLENPLANAKRIAVLGPNRAAFDLLRQRFPKPTLTHIDCAERLAVGSPEWFETIGRARAAPWDILLVCLSFPKQEFFAWELGNQQRKTGLALCVGASIDFLTDRQHRAPVAMQKAGLEWLHRLASDPKRMAQRYLVRGPAIFSMVVKDYLSPPSLPKSPSSDAKPRFGPRVLDLSTVLPHRQQSGGEICSMNFIEALKQSGCDVEVAAYQRAARGVGEALPPGFFSPRELVIESGQAPIRSAFWLARSFARGRPFSVDKYVTEAMRAWVVRRLREVEWDFVIIDHVQTAWLLPFIPEHVPVVLIAHNVEHRLYGAHGAQVEARSSGGLRQRFKAAIFRREGRELLKLEEVAARRSREIWTLTDEDAAVFRSLAPDARVRVFSVPGQSFSETDKLPSAAVDVGLLGSWVWDVNRAGLDWFRESVVPLLPAGLKIVVGGKSNVAPGTIVDGVRFVGFVPDAGAFLRQCRVVVIPSQTGSGIQIKTIETLALGLPTVATPIAMRGIDDAPAHLQVTADAAEMAAAIVKALDTPRPDGVDGRHWWLRRRKQFQQAIATAIAEIVPAHQAVSEAAPAERVEWLLRASVGQPIDETPARALG